MKSLFSSIELERNEEFFSEVETEWQIESFDDGDVKDFEKLEKPPNPMETAAGILPEMTQSSDILDQQQVMYI